MTAPLGAAVSLLTLCIAASAVASNTTNPTPPHTAELSSPTPPLPAPASATGLGEPDEGLGEGVPGRTEPAHGLSDDVQGQEVVNDPTDPTTADADPTATDADPTATDADPTDTDTYPTDTDADLDGDADLDADLDTVPMLNAPPTTIEQYFGGGENSTALDTEAREGAPPKYDVEDALLFEDYDADDKGEDVLLDAGAEEGGGEDGFEPEPTEAPAGLMDDDSANVNKLVEKLLQSDTEDGGPAGNGTQTLDEAEDKTFNDAVTSLTESLTEAVKEAEAQLHKVNQTLAHLDKAKPMDSNASRPVLPSTSPPPSPSPAAPSPQPPAPALAPALASPVAQPSASGQPSPTSTPAPTSSTVVAEAPLPPPPSDPTHPELVGIEEELRHVMREEMTSKEREIKVLQTLTAAVTQLKQQYDGTRQRLMETEHTLQEKEVTEAVDKVIESVTAETTKIDYDTGDVVLKGGNRLTAKQLSDVMTKINAMKDKNRDTKSTVNLDRVDPARISYDSQFLIDIGVMLLGATVGGMVVGLLGAPPSIGYILGGALVGPNALGWVTRMDHVGAMAQFGTIFPLFANGMQFHIKDVGDVHHRQTLGIMVTVTTVLLVATPIIGVFVGLVPNIGEGMLLGLAMALSSPGCTVSNLCSDHLLTTDGGKVTMGLLAFQDLLLGLLLALPSVLKSWNLFNVEMAFGAVFQSLSAFACVMLLTLFLSKRVMPGVIGYFAGREHHRDMYLLWMLALCTSMAVLTEKVGLSLEMGAFCAGLMVTGTTVVGRTMAAIEPLNQLFSSLFFASIGMVISPWFLFTHFGMVVTSMVQLTLGKGCLLYAATKWWGFPAPAAFVVASSMANIAEFSLIFTGQAQALGLVSRTTYLLWLTTTVGMLVMSPLALPVYKRVAKAVGLELDSNPPEDADAAGLPHPLTLTPVSVVKPAVNKQLVMAMSSTTTSVERLGLTRLLSLQAPASGVAPVQAPLSPSPPKQGGDSVHPDVDVEAPESPQPPAILRTPAVAAVLSAGLTRRPVSSPQT